MNKIFKIRFRWSGAIVDAMAELRTILREGHQLRMAYKANLDHV